MSTKRFSFFSQKAASAEEAFKLIDINGDGTLSVDELMEAIAKFGLDEDLEPCTRGSSSASAGSFQRRKGAATSTKVSVLELACAAPGSR